MNITQTILYLYTGADYRFVGFQEGEEFVGFKPGKSFYVKMSPTKEADWPMFPGVDHLFQNESGQHRNFRLHLDKSPKEFEDALMILFKLDLRILLPKDCKVFKAEERRELEKLGFIMTYSSENGIVRELAEYSLDTMRGWATFFTNLARGRGIVSTTEPMCEQSVFASPLFEKVEWKATVGNLDDARDVHLWTAEAEAESRIYFAAVEWGFQRLPDKPKPLIAKIPRGERLLVCFLDWASLKAKKLTADEAAGKYWKIRVTFPDTGKHVGRFQLLEPLEFAEA